MIFGTNVDLRDIEYNDAEFVLSLRLDCELNKHLSIVEDNLEKQREWIRRSKLNPQEYYFIVQNKHKKPVGTIRIYDIKGDSFCWGSWIIIPEARSYASFESAYLLYKFAFLTLNMHKTNFDVRKDNKVAINFYLKFGAKMFEETELDYFMTYSQEDFLLRESEYIAVIEKIKQIQANKT